MARARPARGGRVRPSRHRRQAGPAGGARRGGADAARALRLLARPGDVLLAVGTADDRRRPTCCGEARPGACHASGWEPGRGPRAGRRRPLVWSERVDAGPGGALGRSGPPLPPAVGADPRGVRAPGAARCAAAATPRAGTRCATVCVTCSDEGRGGRGPGRARRAGAPRSLLGGRHETVDVTPRRPGGARRPGAGPRRGGHHRAAGLSGGTGR